MHGMHEGLGRQLCCSAREPGAGCVTIFIFNAVLPIDTVNGCRKVNVQNRVCGFGGGDST
jgi:hypothetical protein